MSAAPTPTLPTPTLALILAAGSGTRMRSRLPKPLHCLAGKPLARYPIDLARRVGIERVAVVVPTDTEPFRAALGPDLEYVIQAEPRGTLNAVLAARPLLEELAEQNGTLVVLPGDFPLLDAVTLNSTFVHHSGTKADLTQLGGNQGNAGVYLFRARAFLQALEATPPPADGEQSLSRYVRRLANSGIRTQFTSAPHPERVRGVNNRVELAATAQLLREQILREHMLAGVTIEDPSSTYVDANVQIGMDTILRPGTHLCGSTVIGEGCDLGPDVRITDCELGESVTAQYAVLTSSVVGDGTKIGPYAQLRPGCRVGRKVKIGNFVELKNAEVEDSVSAGHFAYLGDASIGSKTNIGAGTITCNYDGKRKHRTVIGRSTFIGTHSTLIAPVTVGDGAYVAAGSVVTQEVPPDALAIGRQRQVNREGWAKRRRESEAGE